MTDARTASPPDHRAPDAGAGIGEIRGRTAFVIDVMPGLSERERRVCRMMLRNTSQAVWSVSGQMVTWVGVATIVRAMMFSEPGASESALDRAVKRARQKLVAVGLLEIIDRGGAGRGSNARYLFRLDVVAAVESEARRAGVAQAWGGGDVADGDTPVKGDTRHKGDTPVKGDMGDTHKDGRRGFTPRVASASAVKGDAPVTQSGRVAAETTASACKSVDKPVDKSSCGDAGDRSRVSPGVRKGDKQAPKRVTGVSPEPYIEPDKKTRRGKNGDRRQRELRLLARIDGGRAAPERIAAAVGAVETVARAKRDRIGDQRHQALLDRVSARFPGDPGLAGLASAQLDPDAVSRIRQGWRPDDGALSDLLDDSLRQLRTAGLIPARRPIRPAHVEDAGVAAGLRGDVGRLQEQVTMLVTLVTTLLQAVMPAASVPVPSPESRKGNRHAACA